MEVRAGAEEEERRMKRKTRKKNRKRGWTEVMKVNDVEGLLDGSV